MERSIVLQMFFLLIALAAEAQPPIETRALTAIENLTVVDAYEGEQGYYLFCPSVRPVQATVPIVFVHGYGALNPMIYGKWIRHLTEHGHCVIYPRYQEDLFKTSPHDFTTNAVAAIAEALTRIKEADIGSDTDGLYLVGHSYGGVIIANLAANWRALHLPEPRVAFLCEPGSGPFKGGVLDSYHTIDSTLHMAIMVGDNDETVGQEFGSMVFESAVNTPNRVLLWQYACTQDTFSVSASHYEPYAIDVAFDNGIENFTSRKALRVAQLDHIDTEGYWKVFDMLIAKDASRDVSRFASHLLNKFINLGVWPDGTELCKMGFQCPVQPEAGK
ncbi:MAG TPA: alpha/beta fold hydrolase [Saprospiraceae bacterium]|nr:alpha/beta fold hydrolase [Saprospiraceae bacterium]